MAAQSQELGMQALLAVNKTAIERELLDAASEAPSQRMTFGIYFYAEPCKLEPANPDQLEGIEHAIKS